MASRRIKCVFSVGYYITIYIYYIIYIIYIYTVSRISKKTVVGGISKLKRKVLLPL